MKAVILVVGLLVVVACIVAGVVFLRRGRELAQPSSKSSPQLARSSNPAVKEATKPKKAWAVYLIDHPANVPVCDAVKKLHFRHFGQTQQLPTLPLKDCDKKNICQCFHREIMEKRRAQRRVSRDRREQFRFDQVKAAKPERRVLKDRRADARWEGYDTDR